MNLRLLTRYHIGRRLCTYQSGLRAQTAPLFVNALSNHKGDSCRDVPTPDDAATAATSGDTAKLLLSSGRVVADCRRCWMVNRCRTWFRQIAGVWAVSPLVLVRGGLHDHLSPALPAVRHIRRARHLTKLDRSQHGARRWRVLQPVCRDRVSLCNYGFY